MKLKKKKQSNVKLDPVLANDANDLFKDIEFSG